MKNPSIIYLAIQPTSLSSNTASKALTHTKSGEVFRAQAYKTKVLKTFGAGDSYASAFIYGLVSGKDIETALKYGSASASIVVSKHSSSEAMPTAEEIEQLIEAQS